MIFRQLLLLLFGLILSASGIAQETEIGQWRDHIPYNRGNSVSANGDILYCGSSAGFISFNNLTGEIERFNTITGLSDIGVAMLKFNENTNSLIVAYNNANIDILKGSVITNISAIKDDISGGDKSIINIRIDGNFAYLSTGFGIVVVDMAKNEIKDTYRLGQNSEDLQVNDVYLDHDANLMYAATVEGVRFADMDDNLSDFNSWSKMQNLPDVNGNYDHIDFWSGQFFLNYNPGADQDSHIVYRIKGSAVDTFLEASFQPTRDFQVESDRLIITKFYNILTYDENLESLGIIFIYDEGVGIEPLACIHHQGFYWMADNRLGLVKYQTVGAYVTVAPNGPNTLSVNDADVEKKTVWTTSGILDPDYRGSPNVPEFNRYEEYYWTGMSRFNEGKLDSLYGFIKTKINPFNPGQVFMASWDNGLLEINDGEITQIYNMSTKSETQHSLTPVDGTESLIRVGGLDYDREGNLWITCSETPFALNVLTVDGIWKRYSFGSLVDNQTIVGEVLVAQNGYKWIVLNRSNGNNRIIVFDDKGEPLNNDYRFIALSTDDGNGSIPGSILHCIDQDISGSMWVGSNEGPAVFYSPDFVFDSQQNAQRVLIQQDGQTQILLETEDIRSIKTDGADRKWFGTTNSGAYLMSDDAQNEINHFTRDNSPIFSDEVNDIAIDHDNGEVYFCTSEGLISYKGSATGGGTGFSTVEVYPNPVTQGYSGPIAIKGLAENTNVKITDVNGILVYETTSFGGQATWDGRTISGSRVSNGVYLIFCTDRAGESQEVSKVLFLNN